MRKIILCVLAVMLWSQAVDALECYDCPHGGRCSTTTTCSYRQDRCMTIIIPGVGAMRPTSGKRCGSLYECELMKKTPGINAICCDFDKCNR